MSQQERWASSNRHELPPYNQDSQNQPVESNVDLPNTSSYPTLPPIGIPPPRPNLPYNVLPPLHQPILASTTRHIPPPAHHQHHQPRLPSMSRSSDPAIRLPPPPAPPPQPAHPSNPLNVQDALQYMDLVKATFPDDSAVYNRFLDTMREFKSNTINTRQVIDTVSTLFMDYPDLLSGFNTFLPPGFHIRVTEGAGPSGRNRVQVITPNGTSNSQPLQPAHLSSLLSNHAYHSQGYPPLPQTAPHLPPNPPIFQPILPPASGNPPSVNHQPPPPPPPPADVDFHDAINYVNEIKNHYSHRPEVYRNFLEILHSYQREQHTIDEVYDQLRVLFQDAPHLLQGFQMFLPTISGAASAPTHNHRQAAAPLPPRIPAYSANHQVTPPVLASTSVRQPVHATGPSIDTRLPPVGSFPVTSSQEPIPSLPAHVTPSKKRNAADKKPRANGDKNSNLGPRNIDQDTVAPPTKQSRASKTTVKQETQPSNPISPAPSVEYIDQAASLVTENDAFVLFHVQKHLQKTGDYDTFIKVLDLFQSGCIDIELALQWLKPLFHNHSKLFEGLCLVFNQPVPKPPPTRTILDLYALPTYSFDDVSPSYKRLPKSLHNFASSGKTDLCNEVLNTEYVCPAKDVPNLYRATPPPKNDSEGKLEDLEERRYYFDTEIQCLSYVIKVLTPISIQVTSLPQDQLAKFRLTHAIGDRSISIIRRAIKSIYSVENFHQIMRAIDENPELALPRVVQRMKEKDSEWRIAAKDYELAHSRADSYFYPLSLDRQSSRFKPYDLKNANRTEFLLEIKKACNQNMQTIQNGESFSSRYHLESTLSHQNIHTDLGKLFFTHLQNYDRIDHEHKLQVVEVFKVLFGKLFFIKPFQGLDKSSDIIEPTQSSNHANGESLPSLQQNGHAKSFTSINKPNAPTSEENLNFVPDNVHGIFADSNIYTIIRLYNLVYDRLKRIQSIAEKKKPFQGERGPMRKLIKILDDKLHPDDEVKDYYEAFLNRVQLWLEDQTPTNEFEFDMRKMLGPETYVIFTLKHIFNFLIKYILRMLKNASSESLFFLFSTLSSSLHPFSVRDWWVYQLRSDFLANGEKDLIWIQYDKSNSQLGYQLIYDRDQFALDYILTTKETSMSHIKDWVTKELASVREPASTSEHAENSLASGISSNFQQHLPFLIRNFIHLGTQKRACTEIELNTVDFPEPREQVFVERVPSASPDNDSSHRKKRKLRWQGWMNSEERTTNHSSLDTVKESDHEKDDTTLTESKE